MHDLKMACTEGRN